MEAKIKYPIGIQTFSEIRENGYIYVDNTALIYDLCSQGKYYFLSRPRRFGKSLLLSTIKAYSTICGITEDELRNNFAQGINNLAETLGTDYEGALQELKSNYDGYHFTRNCPDLYNPFSLLNALQDSMLESYWFQTASPTFLVKRLAREKGHLSKLLNDTVSSASISDINTYGSSPLSLLFQTGYLTIKNYDVRRKRYKLGIPNKEVELGLFTALLAYTADMDKNTVDARMWDIRDAFEAGNPDFGLDNSLRVNASQ